MAWVLDKDLSVTWTGYVFNGLEGDPEVLLNDHAYTLTYVGYLIDAQFGQLGYVWRYQTDYLKISYAVFPAYDYTGTGSPTDPSTVLMVTESQDGSPGTYYEGIFGGGLAGLWGAIFDGDDHPEWYTTGIATVSQESAPPTPPTPPDGIPDTGTTFPATRTSTTTTPVDEYDPDLSWSWEDGTWDYHLDLTAIGGGRYNIKTLAFGKDSGTGVIYIGG